MSGFAKIAAEALVDEDLGEEHKDKDTAWKRALPWVGGLGAALGAGYLAHKYMAPTPNATGPGLSHALGKTLGLGTETFGHLGRAAIGGLGGAAGRLSKDLKDWYADRNLTMSDLAERAKRSAPPPRGNWGKLLFGESAYDPKEVATLGNRLNANLEGKATGQTNTLLGALEQHYGPNGAGGKDKKIEEVIAELRDKSHPTGTGPRHELGTLLGTKVKWDEAANDLEHMARAGKRFGKVPGANQGYRIAGRSLARGGVYGGLTLGAGYLGNLMADLTK